MNSSPLRRQTALRISIVMLFCNIMVLFSIFSLFFLLPKQGNKKQKIHSGRFYHMLNTIESINNAVNNFYLGSPRHDLHHRVGLYLKYHTNFLQIRKFSMRSGLPSAGCSRKQDASDVP